MIITLTIVVVVIFMQRRFILRPLNPPSQMRSDIIWTLMMLRRATALWGSTVLPVP